mgnify:CR=1 FL=1
MKSIISNAQDGDSLAATNILHYFLESISLGVKIRSEVVSYLLDSIQKISLTERVRLAKGLGIDAANPDAVDILEKLPNISPKAKERLIIKICTSMGRTPLTNTEECERIRIGAEVSMLHAQYRDRDSTDYTQTKGMGQEPLERAILEIANKKFKSTEAVRRSYRLYQKFNELGCVDQKGEFILKSYDWLFPEND